MNKSWINPDEKIQKDNAVKTLNCKPYNRKKISSNLKHDQNNEKIPFPR